ncbi:MAG: anti-sigma factor antagonist [Gemmataceae bacterium]|nr:anti-sigma factor antagonist [Gemmataceae bacterium]
MDFISHLPTKRSAIAFKTGHVGEQARKLTDTFDRHTDGPVTHVLIDLENVEYVGSEDIGAIVGLHNKVRGAGGQLILVNVRPKVSEVISITRLDSLLQVHKIGQASVS